MIELNEYPESDPAEFGYIYIASNAAMPGLLKIGFTLDDPVRRVRQLGSHAGVPVRFRLQAAFFSVCAAYHEKLIHRLLREYRLPNREFFEVSVQKAIETCNYITGVDE